MSAGVGEYAEIMWAVSREKVPALMRKRADLQNPEHEQFIFQVFSLQVDPVIIFAGS